MDKKLFWSILVKECYYHEKPEKFDGINGVEDMCRVTKSAFERTISEYSRRLSSLRKPANSVKQRHDGSQGSTQICPHYMDGGDIFGAKQLGYCQCEGKLHHA